MLVISQCEIKNAIVWMTQTNIPETLVNRNEGGRLKSQQDCGHAVITDQFARPQVLQSPGSDPF